MPVGARRGGVCNFLFQRRREWMCQLLVVMWNSFSHSAAQFPSVSTHWMVTTAAFVSCFNSLVILRAASCKCNAFWTELYDVKKKCWPTV